MIHSNVKFEQRNERRNNKKKNVRRYRWLFNLCILFSFHNASKQMKKAINCTFFSLFRKNKHFRSILGNGKPLFRIHILFLFNHSIWLSVFCFFRKRWSSFVINSFYTFLCFIVFPIKLHNFSLPMPSICHKMNM